MSEVLTGLEGMVCLIDDVLVYGNTEEQHDQHLKDALSKISNAGLTLNKEKCIFGVTKINFLGQSVDSDGIKPDPRKVQAIHEMKPPSNLTELRRFLGMITSSANFPHIWPTRHSHYEHYLVPRIIGHGEMSKTKLLLN